MQQGCTHTKITRCKDRDPTSDNRMGIHSTNINQSRASAWASHDTTACSALFLLLEKVWPHVASEPRPIPLITGDVVCKVAFLISLKWDMI
jgi:hypothetical protein